MFSYNRAFIGPAIEILLDEEGPVSAVEVLAEGVSQEFSLASSQLERCLGEVVEKLVGAEQKYDSDAREREEMMEKFTDLEQELALISQQNVQLKTLTYRLEEELGATEVALHLAETEVSDRTTEGTEGTSSEEIPLLDFLKKSLPPACVTQLVEDIEALPLDHALSPATRRRLVARLRSRKTVRRLRQHALYSEISTTPREIEEVRPLRLLTKCQEQPLDVKHLSPTVIKGCKLSVPFLAYL
ncbi:MAG: LOW QUALITY PROTEIN: uncharacterized protein KVP18_000252 [Porospora cf. gigantea A]|uniref:uncharacterized protein n=1 Tax=Porospora cf. gigantea A TaxID=2853593 RepID=UPI00355A5A8C|nr:MAG: LOW QUALITY PROTEIN: hypothetical protein KVP18_000252 [Porospora cf. gigantea A]